MSGVTTRGYPDDGILSEAHVQAEHPSGMDSAEADCLATERLCQMVLSLPKNPYMMEEMVSKMSKMIKGLFYGN